ncbi:hypothetical protein M2138_001601 [Dysgonomonadaceae bacterium PH5-43]|nr:hypothetical protein [Dysgonomonadaceae bacterium PH5-43]
MKNAKIKLYKPKGLIKRSVLNLTVSIVSLFIVSCGDDEPTLTDSEANNFGISCIAELNDKATDILRTANGTNELVNVYITNNIGVLAEEKEILKFLGEFKRQTNIRVDWSQNPDIDTNTLRSSSDNFGVYPIGLVTLTNDEYKNVFGGEFTLLSNPETNETIIVPKDELSEFEESGSQVAVLDSSKDWIVNNVDEMYSLLSLIPDRKDDAESITFVFNEILASGTSEVRSAKSVLRSSNNGEVRGLTASKKSHITMLKTLATTENVNITNNNVKTGEHGLEIDADFAIDHYNIVNDGKYNNNKLFRVNGVNGASRLSGKYDAGVYFATDTASYGADAKKLDNFVMDQMTVDVDGAPASGLTKLGDWRGSTIKVKQAKIDGGYGVAGLHGHTNATFRTFSTPNTAKFGATTFQFEEKPALGIWVDSKGVLPTGRVPGGLAVDTMYVGGGDYTYEKMMDGRISFYSMDFDTIPLVFCEKPVTFAKVALTGYYLKSLREFATWAHFELDLDPAKTIIGMDQEDIDAQGGEKGVLDFLKSRYVVKNGHMMNIIIMDENQH